MGINKSKNKKSQQGKDKLLIKAIDLMVYPVKVAIAVGDMEDEINASYKNTEGLEKIEFPLEANACTIWVQATNGRYFTVLIWFKDKEACTLHNVIHECTHAAMTIFEYIDAVPDTKNQEPFAYLMGSIARIVGYAFEKKGWHIQ